MCFLPPLLRKSGLDFNLMHNSYSVGWFIYLLCIIGSEQGSETQEDSGMKIFKTPFHRLLQVFIKNSWARYMFYFIIYKFNSSIMHMTFIHLCQILSRITYGVWYLLQYPLLLCLKTGTVHPHTWNTYLSLWLAEIEWLRWVRDCFLECVLAEMIQDLGGEKPLRKVVCRESQVEGGLSGWQRQMDVMFQSVNVISSILLNCKVWGESERGLWGDKQKLDLEEKVHVSPRASWLYLVSEGYKLKVLFERKWIGRI